MERYEPHKIRGLWPDGLYTERRFFNSDQWDGHPVEFPYHRRTGGTFGQVPPWAQPIEIYNDGRSGHSHGRLY